MKPAMLTAMCQEVAKYALSSTKGVHDIDINELGNRIDAYVSAQVAEIALDYEDEDEDGLEIEGLDEGDGDIE